MVDSLSMKILETHVSGHPNLRVGIPEMPRYLTLLQNKRVILIPFHMNLGLLRNKQISKKFVNHKIEIWY